MKKIITVLAIAISLIACNAQSGNKINTEEFIVLSAADNVKVIDVRSSSEVAEGYISEADYFIDINSSDFEDEIANLDKEVIYIVYCRSGIRSSNAVKYMKEQGFIKLYDLSGGITSFEEPSMIIK